MSEFAKVEDIFSIPLYMSKIDLNDIDVVDIPTFSDSVNALGAQRCQLSSSDSLLNENRFFSLRKQIDTHMNRFYYDILGYSNITSPYMSSSWLVRSLPGQRSDWHLHRNCIFSGVVYLQVNDKSGNISFMRPRYQELCSTFQPPIQQFTAYNSDISLALTRGMIIIFPSQIQHRVEQNNSDEERISIAFNYFLKGKFTKHTESLELR